MKQAKHVYMLLLTIQTQMNGEDSVML